MPSETVAARARAAGEGQCRLPLAPQTLDHPLSPAECKASRFAFGNIAFVAIVVGQILYGRGSIFSVHLKNGFFAVRADDLECFAINIIDSLRLNVLAK